MTFEELKAEATRHGYNLVKIKPKEKFLPCTCGCNQRTHWFSTVDDSITKFRRKAPCFSYGDIR